MSHLNEAEENTDCKQLSIFFFLSRRVHIHQDCARLQQYSHCCLLNKALSDTRIFSHAWIVDAEWLHCEFLIREQTWESKAVKLSKQDSRPFFANFETKQPYIWHFSFPLIMHKVWMEPLCLKSVLNMHFFLMARRGRRHRSQKRGLYAIVWDDDPTTHLIHETVSWWVDGLNHKITWRSFFHLWSHLELK